jgi:hypothetical protein
MMRNQYKQYIWRIVTSRSLSTWLLILWTVMLVLSAILPDPELMPPDAIADLSAHNPLLMKIGSSFNSRKLATGYIFGFIGIYLIVSATLCSIDRLYSRRREQDDVLPAVPSAAHITIFVPAVGHEPVRGFVTAWLRRRLVGISVVQNLASGAIVFRRGRFGFWGSILFHSILVTALVGMVLFYLGGTRGKLAFTEGQAYRLEKSRFIRLEKEPLWGINLPKVKLELMTHYSIYANDDPSTVIDHLARFRVTDLERGGTSIRDIKVNSPLYLDGNDFLLMSGGFSPRMVISGDGDQVLFDSFVNLKGDFGVRDDFFAADGLHVQVRLFPDLMWDREQPLSRSSLLNNPAALITVTRGGSTLLNDMVPVGASVRAGGYRLAIPEVRRWVELEMVNEPGIGFFFVISFFGILGILVRMLDPDEQLTALIHEEGQGTRISFEVYSPHFSALLAGVAAECSEAAALWAGERMEGIES